MPSRQNEAPPPEAAARLKTDVTSQAGRSILALRGELDLATVSVAEQAFARVDGVDEAVVLDLRGLTFLDSSGLRFILATAKACDEAERRMFVVRGPAQVERVFELTGAAERLNIVDDPSRLEAA